MDNKAGESKKKIKSRDFLACFFLTDVFFFNLYTSGLCFCEVIFVYIQIINA